MSKLVDMKALSPTTSHTHSETTTLGPTSSKSSMTFDKGSMRDGASDKGKKHDWCLFSRMGLAYSPDDTASEHKRKFWKRMKVGGMMSSGGGGSA